jgi:hypothetical protein
MKQYSRNFLNNTKGELIFATAVDTARNRYNSNYHLWKFDANGNFVWKRTLDDFYATPCYISIVVSCIDSSDNIYHLNGRYLLKYNDDGDLIYSIDAKELVSRSNGILWYFEEGAEFRPPIRQLETDIDGNLYFHLYVGLILKFDTDGNFLWVSDDFGEYYGVHVEYMALSKNYDPIIISSLEKKLVFLDKETGLVQKELNLNNVAAYSDAISGINLDTAYVVDFNVDKNNDILLVLRIIPTVSDSYYILLKFDIDGNNSWYRYLEHDRSPNYSYDHTSSWLFEVRLDTYNNICCFSHNYFTYDSRYFYGDDYYKIYMYKYSSEGKLLWTSTFGGLFTDKLTNMSISNQNKMFIIGTTIRREGISYGNAYLKEHCGIKNKFVWSDYLYWWNSFMACFEIDSIGAVVLDTEQSNSPDTLEIDHTCTGSSNYLDIMVKSQSDFTINFIDDKVFNNGVFSAEYLDDTNVEPGYKINLRVSFSPTDTGYYEEMLYIYCEERETPLDSILVRAKADYAEFEVRGNRDFEYLRIGDNKRLDVFVKNIGTTGAYIKDIDAMEEPFSISYTIPYLPEYIGIGEELKVRVRMEATELGIFTGYLDIYSIESDSTCPANITATFTAEVIDKYLKIDSLNFGSIAYCETKTDTIHVLNRYENAITLKYSELLGDDADNFRIVSEPTPNYQLDYKDTALYIIEFYPQAPHKDKQAF